MSAENKIKILRKNSILFVQDLHKWYGKLHVLDDIDLSVASGTFCTVVGPSGCGKSTLLRLILGQEKQTSGILEIEKSAVGYADNTRGIVYQKYSLFPHLSVLDNVLLGKMLSTGLIERLKRKKEFIDEAMSFLEKVRLSGHHNKFPHELSGGMRQRVAIAQSLIMRPKILLMDEPFGALDPGTREDMQIFLLDLVEETKTTVFFVTHDLPEAVFLGTRLLVLSQFWTDDRGDEVKRGARIVCDLDLSKFNRSTSIKETAEFGELVESIRREGFDPEFKQNARAFNLKHGDSYQTLEPEECRDSV